MWSRLWRLKLELGTVYRAEIKYSIADSLSRLKTKGEGETLLDDDVPVFTVPQQILEVHQRKHSTSNSW